MPGKKQPARAARQKPVDAVMATLLDELKTLKEKVAELSQSKDSSAQIATNDEDMIGDQNSRHQDTVVQTHVDSSVSQVHTQHAAASATTTAAMLELPCACLCLMIYSHVQCNSKTLVL